MQRASRSLHFFFSSRRRHTRFSRDWSSDVCSSDLDEALVGGDLDKRRLRGAFEARRRGVVQPVPQALAAGLKANRRHFEKVVVRLRSEERRVGKEGRARTAACAERAASEGSGEERS